MFLVGGREGDADHQNRDSPSRIVCGRYCVGHVSSLNSRSERALRELDAIISPPT